jgi:hypothetical protein
MPRDRFVLKSIALHLMDQLSAIQVSNLSHMTDRLYLFANLDLL